MALLEVLNFYAGDAGNLPELSDDIRQSCRSGDAADIDVIA